MVNRKKAAPKRAATRRQPSGVKKPAGRRAARSVAPPVTPQPLRVVGIGASAGGLDAFRELLQHLPIDSGMAFVIVMHLARDQKSMLPDILSRSTKMTVVELVEATPVRPDHVYVMSSNTDVEYAHGVLVVRKRDAAKRHMPVDRLFATLAEGLGDLSVGVILSGTDTDGSIGAQHIKAAGGVTFAQDNSAQFDGMPHSAIDKGVVDFVFSPREIARKIVDLGARRVAVGADSPSSTPELNGIIDLLSAPERIDFLHYKTPTIERRIHRRMLLHNIDDLGLYRRKLANDPEEREALRRDVLIGVTRFFRDPSRAALLRKKIFPTIFRGPVDGPLRFWVPACSTGEEAYSLAMLVVEYLTDKKLSHSVQIFGSDIREDAVAFARAGLYPSSIEETVSPERLQQFFTPGTGGGYSVSRTIRDLCIFAEHNLLKDPPFSRLDLISCSNLLIYLQPAQQERVAATFRYALNASGLLILGPSESLRANAEGFVIVDKKHKVYRVAAGSRPRLDLSFRKPRREEAPVAGPSIADSPANEVGAIVDRLLLGRYAHPALIVNEAGDVIEFRGDLQPYLAPASGTPSFKLSKLLHQELLIDVRTALFKARSSGKPVRRERLKIEHGDASELVDVEVVPVTRSPHDRIYVVVFEAVVLSGESEARLSSRRRPKKRSETDRLKKELTASRDYMTHLTSEHEQSDSVLNATSEQLQQANEELQSTVEELETAKEELQSTNEELSTLNDELRIRNADLAVVGDDLMNLLTSIDTPVIMVDRELIIRLFNPTAERLFSLRQSDVGRPLAAFKPLMELPDLAGILRRVIDTPTILDSEVQSVDGHWYSLRVRPYRSSRNQIEGAVVTLIDTHQLRSALSIAEESRDVAERARTAADQARLDALEANRLKDDFLSTLSHELRTPMTSILGWAQMMRMTTLDKETMATAVATIERGTYAQIRLIDDLLDISRITTGRLRLEQRSFRLRAMVEETLDVVRPAVTAKQISVHTDFEAAPVLLYGDPDRLRQVIWNLLSNAVKFTPAGGTIEVSASQSRGAAVIQVRDSGEGIEPEFLPRVFERFSQGASGTTRQKQGLGLGLAISKYVVDLHGGTIVAASAGLNHGSTFTITLPFVGGATREESMLSYSTAVTSGEFPRMDGMTVLVVDDDADSLKLVALALSECGANVLQADSVRSALGHLQSSAPAVVVSDIAMPVEDGIDLLRQVRALGGAKAKVPMVALSAFTSADDRRRILAAGFDEYMAKPVAPLHLMHVVAELGVRAKPAE